MHNCSLKFSNSALVKEWVLLQSTYKGKNSAWYVHCQVLKFPILLL